MKKITKQKAREAFDSLFTNHYDHETKHYQEFYSTSTHPEDIMIEYLEESDYKNLRMVDKYFNPNYWKEDITYEVRSNDCAV